jgi:hypothetical protein
MPGRESQKGLHRQVKLGAEATAYRCGNNTDGLCRNAEELGYIGAVQVRRLGAGLDFDGVAHAAGESGLGLDAGMLDKGGFKLRFHDREGGGQGLIDITARDAASGQDIAWAMGVNEAGAGR